MCFFVSQPHFIGGDIISTYYYNINDLIKDDKRDLIIIEREIRTSNKDGKISNRKWYKYRCNKCGNEDWVMEYDLKHNQGCNVCRIFPRKVLVGYNDLATTDPWMIKYLNNIDDATRYTKSSSSKVDMVCPFCGNVREYPIEYLYKLKKLPCICNDKVSYPNKYMYALLKQLDLDFISEKRFNWSGKYTYDDYIIYNNKQIITEQHGMQHYKKPIAIGNRYRAVEDEQKNDLNKYELAIKNGIDYYFIIDCRFSDPNYIKENIINSGLLSVLNVEVNDVNWDYCSEYALSNLIKEICEFKELHPNMRMQEIADIFHFHKDTIRNYLNYGRNIGWSSYQVGDDKFLPNRMLQKPVYCVNTDTYYESAKMAAKMLNLNDRMIKEAANKRKPYKNMNFLYISREEFNKLKTESPSNVVGDFFIYQRR